MCWRLTTVTKYNEYEAEQTSLLYALSFSDFTIQNVQWPLWQNFYFFRNLHCLLGMCKKRGGEGGRGELPFSFCPDYPPLLAPARQAWFYKKEQMMEMLWLSGQQICPVYYISMLTVSSKVAKKDTGLAGRSGYGERWRPRNMPAFAGYYNFIYELTVTHPTHDMKWCVQDTHHQGNFPCSFQPVVWVLLHPLPFHLTNERRVKGTSVMA